jgi:hypothetical protein
MSELISMGCEGTMRQVKSSLAEALHTWRHLRPDAVPPVPARKTDRQLIADLLALPVGADPLHRLLETQLDRVAYIAFAKQSLTSGCMYAEHSICTL